MRRLGLMQLAASLLLCLTLCAAANEPTSSVPFDGLLGTFDEEGVLHNPTEKTYKLPDIGVFVGYFPEHGDLTTGLIVEVYDRRDRRGLFNWFKYDLTFSDQRIGIAVGRKVFPVIDVTVSAIYSRDFERNESTWGFAMSLIKF